MLVCIVLPAARFVVMRHVGGGAMYAIAPCAAPIKNAPMWSVCFWLAASGRCALVLSIDGLRSGSVGLGASGGSGTWGADSGVYRFAQGFAWLEVGDTFSGHLYGLATAWVATQTGLAVRNGKATKTTDLDTLATHQRVFDGVQNRFDSLLRITLCELVKTFCKLFNQIGSGHTDGNVLE